MWHNQHKTNAGSPRGSQVRCIPLGNQLDILGTKSEIWLGKWCEYHSFCAPEMSPFSGMQLTRCSETLQMMWNRLLGAQIFPLLISEQIAGNYYYLSSLFSNSWLVSWFLSVSCRWKLSTGLVSVNCSKLCGMLGKNSSGAIKWNSGLKWINSSKEQAVRILSASRHHIHSCALRLGSWLASCSSPSKNSMDSCGSK